MYPIIWNRYVIFIIANIFQHDCQMPCICMCKFLFVPKIEIEYCKKWCHNFELWCLVLPVELVWYIQRSKPQPVLPVYDSNISILLHKQQYQLSGFSFPCTCQLWSFFERSTQGWLYGLRKATLLTVDPMMAASWNSSVTMVNKKHHELKLHSEHHPSVRIGF